jgi:cytochrome c-type biogenesis protein CcmH/NrfF
MNDKKQKQHERNRMKEMAIKVSKTMNPQAVVEGFKNLSEKTQERVVHQAAPRIAQGIIKAAGVGMENTQENLKRYSQVCLTVTIPACRFDPTGQALNKIRSNILKNLPPDMKKMLDEGKSRQEVIDFYTGVPEFMQVFKKLGWDETMIESLVENEITK